MIRNFTSYLFCDPLGGEIVIHHAKPHALNNNGTVIPHGTLYLSNDVQLENVSSSNPSERMQQQRGSRVVTTRIASTPSLIETFLRFSPKSLLDPRSNTTLRVTQERGLATLPGEGADPRRGEIHKHREFKYHRVPIPWRDRERQFSAEPSSPRG